MNILLAMIPAFLWGTTYAVISTPPDWRQFFSVLYAPCLRGYCRLIKPSLPRGRQWRGLTVLALVNIALFFAFIFVMAVNLPAAIAGVGMVSVPVVAMIYTWVVKGQRPSAVQSLCAVAIVTIAWLLFDPQHVELSLLGLAALAGALLCIVIGSSLVQTVSMHIHWWTVLTWQLIIGGTALLIAAAVQASIFTPDAYTLGEPMTAKQWIALFWLIVPNTALAYTCTFGS